ncbi:MAG: 3-methyl-2-oxobutanoate hydroxymethyltransferase [Clostridia bacterium]|nr:3-methyl-2-oxobutanoate hydroxymethyltransferase [Clostridia bacterium]
MKTTTADFAAMKKRGEKISMLTAYDYSTAKLMDGAGVNSVLVGDSLGMVMLGYEDTISVTMEDMIHHSAAVARGAKDALVICDMPFMSYQTSVYDAVKNAGRLMQEGRAQAVKLEGGVKFKEHIRAITDAAIPVCGHVGMTPQSVNAFGGFKVQGRTLEAAKNVIDDALAVEEAGAFAVVLECVPSALAEYISSLLTIPTIGIGAGAGCDGQVLVYQDMLGMYSDMVPKFVRRFADVGDTMKAAFKEYDRTVKSGEFPAAEHGFKMDESIMNELMIREGGSL